MKVDIRLRGLAQIQRKALVDVLVSPPLRNFFRSALTEGLTTERGFAPRRTGRLRSLIQGFVDSRALEPKFAVFRPLGPKQGGAKYPVFVESGSIHGKAQPFVAPTRRKMPALLRALLRVTKAEIEEIWGRS